MWDRIDPLRPDAGSPRVTSVKRLRRDERRDREDRREDERRERDDPPGPEAGHVDVRA